jgi:aryl-alcohol dehydrogenase-like predicted oxidoreductase
MERGADMKMNYYRLKGMEKRYSQLVMGTMYFTPENYYEFVCPILDAFVKVGGNTLDTAIVYAGGKSEVAIGMWMKERGNRENMVILAKGARENGQEPNKLRVNPEAINQDILLSFERLQTDYIDMYALHRDDPDFPVGPIIDTLNEHIAAGRIKAIGGSNWSYQRLQEANDYAAKNGLVGFSFSSPNLSLAKPSEPYWPGCIFADSGTLSWHKANQFSLVSWSSQARGFFTERFSPENPEYNQLVRVFQTNENRERKRRAEQLAAEKNVTANHIALAYVLSQPFPVSAIIGPQNETELNASLVAMRIRLTEDEVKWLDLYTE